MTDIVSFNRCNLQILLTSEINQTIIFQASCSHQDYFFGYIKKMHIRLKDVSKKWLCPVSYNSQKSELDLTHYYEIISAS